MPGPLLVLVSAVVHASSNTPAPTAWVELDRELEALSTSLQAPNAGPAIGGWLRTRFANSSDVDASAAPGDQDLSGFNLDSVRLVLTGKAAEAFSYTLSMEAGDPLTSDAGGPGVGLLDAFVSVALSDTVAVSIGRFGATTLWSTAIEDRRLLFLDRGFLGEALDGRDVGVEFSGAFGRLNGWATVQNGIDAEGKDLALSARLSYHVLGDSLCTCEGCCGMADQEHLTVGVTWFDDAGLDAGTLLLGDAFFTKGGWSAIVEVADLDDDLRPGTAINPATGVVIPGAFAVTGAQTPWNASAAYMFTPDEWEAAVRYQDLDDDDDTTLLTLAVNRYIGGHNAKWTAQFDRSDSDNTALEADTLAVGLTVGF